MLHETFEWLERRKIFQMMFLEGMMSNATISAQPGSAKPVQELELRNGFPVIDVVARDGIKIPIPAHFVGQNSEIRVDGDGSCSLGMRYNYLVTIVNSNTKPKNQAAELMMKTGEGLLDELKQHLLESGLKALRSTTALQYLIKGVKLVGEFPVTITTALLLDAEKTGKAPEGALEILLSGGSLACIHWIGESMA